MPNKFLRVEGLVILILSILAFSKVSGAWWLFALLLMVPDVSMAGYLVNNKVGALIYNLGHSLVLPLIAIGVGYFGHRYSIIIYASIWLAHIGIDRALGFGLKKESGFKHTHLGDIKI